MPSVWCSAVCYIFDDSNVTPFSGACEVQFAHLHSEAVKDWQPLIQLLRKYVTVVLGIAANGLHARDQTIVKQLVFYSQILKSILSLPFEIKKGSQAKENLINVSIKIKNSDEFYQTTLFFENPKSYFSVTHDINHYK